MVQFENLTAPHTRNIEQPDTHNTHSGVQLALGGRGTGILRREMTMDEARDELIDMIVRVSSGRNTVAEVLNL